MTDARVELHHQYPWRLQEIVTLLVLFAIPCGTVAALLTHHAGRGTLIGTGVSVTALCWGLAGYAAYLGFTRKRRSRIQGSLDGTSFSFTGGRFKRSSGDLADHPRVAVRRVGPEQALVFSRDAGDPDLADPEVLVPLRLIRPNAGGHDDLNATLHRLLGDGRHQVSDDARQALATT